MCGGTPAHRKAAGSLAIGNRNGRAADRLNHATMDTIRRHVVGLVKEPNPFPLEQNVAQIFGREDQLVRATNGISRINREEAPAVRGDGDA